MFVLPPPDFQPAVVQNVDVQTEGQRHGSPRDNLFGDWGGLRTRLLDQGIRLSVSYRGEAATNVSGGTRKDITSVGMFTFGVHLDLEQFTGLKGGSIQSNVTKRVGHSLNQRAGIDALEEPQEEYGRGQTWRWTELWYRQELANGHLIVKLGRLAGGEFNNWGCDFTNLSFCGSPAGTNNIYLWYNWPVAEWGGWFRVRSSKAFFHGGVNEDNPRNLDTNFFVAQFHGARGVVAHAEAGWTPTFGSGRLGGLYQVGGWYDTAADSDTLYDRAGRPAVTSGAPFAQRSGQTGFYVQIMQQLTGSAAMDDATNLLKPRSGITFGFNYEHGDARTATTLDNMFAEVLATAPFPGRTDDQAGIAFGRSRVTSRIRELAAMDGTEGPRRTEYRGEIFYRFAAYRWLSVRPDAQVIINPAGYTRRTTATVLGARVDLNF